ncbi:hypothetical protein BDV09DRAFT_200308 [Aspergillus tetrazonus]
MGKGRFGTYTCVSAALMPKLPLYIDPIEAATMRLIYMTAVYAFEHATHTHKRQKLLIQSASGGLGLAAIRLARSKKAEIPATAGPPDKGRFLTEEMGIAASHIFPSATQQVRAHRPRHRSRRLRVILSTAQSDMLYESIKALAPLGHLIDVERLGMTSAMSLGLEVSFESVLASPHLILIS